MALLGLYLRLSRLKCAVFILMAALGLYIPYAFLFSQATIIHSHGYDVYIAIPLILALFAVLPACIESLTKNTGIIVLLTIGLAFCYSMAQIRTYAIQYPVYDFSVTRELIARMPTAFNAKTAGDLIADIQFHVTGNEHGDYYLRIANGQCTFHEGVSNSPRLTIDTPFEVLVAISEGEIEIQQAFMEQKFSASGDISLLLKLDQLFRIK